MSQFAEGDEVFMMAKVYRANDEQALVEFQSMEGPFSVRVPVSILKFIEPDEEGEV